VADIFGGGWCTYHQPNDFFSYRRDHTTGRMATLIWRE
jgi:copper oxidase (laccase) domain-containing protein